MLNFNGFFILLGVICGTVSSEIVQGSCGAGYKQCEIGACLLEKYVCDGIVHCPDETDEKNCSDTFNILEGNDETISQPITELQQEFCEEGYVACETGSICVSKQNVCDGVSHCLDNSDEKNCDLRMDRIAAELALIATTQITDVDTTTLPSVSMTPASEEDLNTNSDEKEKDFRLGDDENHCAHYKRMIVLVRRVHVKLAKMDKKTARLFRHLINEILMEAGMENFSSLLELHQVCNRKTEEDIN